MNKKKSQNPIKIPSARADDKPATRGMLKILRDELREEIKSGQFKLTASVKKEITNVKQIINQTNQVD